MRLFDSEINVMELLWDQGELSASELARQLSDKIDWNKNTTYTVIKKCVQKGAIERKEPGFVCRPLVSRQEVQKEETEALIRRLFKNSKSNFLTAFMETEKLSKEEQERLLRFIEEQRE